MRTKLKKSIEIGFFIIAILIYILLIYVMISAYFNGLGSDNYTGNPIEIVPKRYKTEALIFFIKWHFIEFGLITIPIYIIAILYIVVYIRKLRKRRQSDDN